MDERDYKAMNKQENGNEVLADVRRSFKFYYKFGHLSKEGYRHFPIIYLAYGKNGFLLCLLGATITVKLW